MRNVVLAGFFALTASASFAQTGAAPESNVAVPAAPSADAPAASQQSRTNGPANLCQELVAFMRAPPAAPAPPANAGAPAEKNGSAQAASAQGGPAHAAPEPSQAVQAESTPQNAELKSSLSAPTPTDSTSTPKRAVMSVAEAEELVGANDIRACRDATRELRLAGVAVPPPLLALAALDLRYQQTGAQQR